MLAGLVAAARLPPGCRPGFLEYSIRDDSAFLANVTTRSPVFCKAETRLPLALRDAESSTADLRQHR
ncbi:MAG: hypothetical protein JNK99_04305 [Candidatus Accumulibacter sp.]|uniref:hypothetical protein n=1 Tax=Accumulibacter sp. TaxID=2053492 RepID=UPI001A52F769|nr:hypothetical protein [Accumulibacter sp.]MBL8393962.1 hypothetical protein [Accumulibacter sp.]